MKRLKKTGKTKLWQSSYLVGASSLLFFNSVGLAVKSLGFALGSSGFYEGFQNVSSIKSIDEFFIEQKEHLQKCGHLKYDFVEKAKELGVQLPFSRNNFTLLKPHTYLYYLENLEKLKTEEEDSEVHRKAREKKITLRESYENYASQNCGFPPVLGYKEEESFIRQESYLLTNQEAEEVESLKEKFQVNLVFLPHNNLDKMSFLKSFSSWLEGDKKRREVLSKAFEVVVHHEVSLEPKKYEVYFLEGKLYVDLYPGFRQKPASYKLSVSLTEYADMDLPFFTLGFDDTLLKAIEDLF